MTNPNPRHPVLLALSMLTLAAIACNFPGTSNAAADSTATANAIASQTAIKNSTASAGNDILFMTQTAAVPSGTPLPTATATGLPTATTDPNLPTPAGPPTQTSIAKETLKVGVEAIVRTGTDILRLRDAPTLKGNVLTTLPGDTRVKIVGGPQAADGFLWWQVNVLTSGASGAPGKTGWVSEQAGGRQTIEAAR